MCRQICSMMKLCHFVILSQNLYGMGGAQKFKILNSFKIPNYQTKVPQICSTVKFLQKSEKI
jgi:hypothetical protein